MSLVDDMLAAMERIKDAPPRPNAHWVMSVKACAIMFGVSEDEVRRQLNVPPECKTFMARPR